MRFRDKVALGITGLVIAATALLYPYNSGELDVPKRIGDTTIKKHSRVHYSRHIGLFGYGVTLRTGKTDTYYELDFDNYDRGGLKLVFPADAHIQVERQEGGLFGDSNISGRIGYTIKSEKYPDAWPDTGTINFPEANTSNREEDIVREITAMTERLESAVEDPNSDFYGELAKKKVEYETRQRNINRIANNWRRQQVYSDIGDWFMNGVNSFIGPYVRAYEQAIKRD